MPLKTPPFYNQSIYPSKQFFEAYSLDAADGARAFEAYFRFIQKDTSETVILKHLLKKTL